MDSLIALLLAVIVTAVAWWRTGRRPDHAPPADEREKERTTLSVDLRDRD